VTDSDASDDIAATALVSLSKIGAKLSIEYLQQYQNKQSWYDVKRIAALKAVENIGNPAYLELVKPNASFKYNYAVRQQALSAWAACAPTDPQLIDALMKFAKDDILPVRATAIALLGKLKIARAVPMLEEISTKNGDSDIRKIASDALEQIRRVK